MVGPDEPRYASIGREMARSGDWITPRLDGQPWFEKPPLTYWLTAAGHLLHLQDEWAARLPEALLSLVFLAFFYAILAREFSPHLALAATAILGTSAGWMAYSFAALTDLPMSAALGAAVLLTLFGAKFDTRNEATPKRAWIAGAFLGLSILGKGFVPLVLFAPLLLIARGRRWAILTGAVVVAAPWYVLCWMRNGSAFWDDLFWKQHVARFLTPALEHVQPFWYYVPILLAGIFPWTPLAALLARRKVYDDARVRLLAAWVVYGLMFFSVSRNKLPGYVLPLLPALAIVLAAALEKAPMKEWWLAACAVLLIALPTVAAILPDALLAGLSRAHIAFAPAGLIFALAAAGVWWLTRRRKTNLAVIAVAAAAGLGALYIKYTAFPQLDQTVSVRGFWRSSNADGGSVCLDGVRRGWQYGLNYYAGRALPECRPSDAAQRIVVRDGRLAIQPLQ